MMKQNDLLYGLEHCQMAVEELKALRPIFQLILDQFPEEWEEEWLDVIYWLIDRCRSEVDCCVDLLDTPISRTFQAIESGLLKQGGLSHE